MSRRLRILVLLSSFIALSPFHLAGQEDSSWRISPEKINIQMEDDRILQLLDDSAQELHGAVWSVLEPDLADIREEDGRAVLHPKAEGTVRVSAVLDGETRFRDITIWPPQQPLPPGTTKWSVHPIGREIGDIPAVPTADGVEMFSLEQTASGSTYLRGGGNDGVQLWVWLMPETTSNVELVCGDWMGGALISANHADSFTLYTVGKDGQLRWQHTFAGVRKGHAYNLQHLVHILSQSPDGTVTKVTGLDEETGAQKFELVVPPSHGKLINVGTQGSKVVCASTSATNPLTTVVSRIFVNMDGYAYIAFTQNEWQLEAKNCLPGTVLDPHGFTFARDEKLLLWQIHPDGTYRSSVVEATKTNEGLSTPVTNASPTGAIIPDNMNGTLISVRFSHTVLPENIAGTTDEYVYRVDPEGAVLYKFLLPKYSGKLNDEMVLGSDQLAFATRGGLLIAFNQSTGKEIWRWDSNTPEISVVAALASGACLVQTPTDAVIVENSTTAKEYLQGQVMLGWNGQVYRKH
jgi:outer membrane protein assembly factor BamB